MHIQPPNLLQGGKNILQENDGLFNKWWENWIVTCKGIQLEYIVQLSHPYMTTGKTITLTRWTFVGK